MTSVPVKEKAYVLRGFAEGLKHLNDTCPSAGMIKTPAGRAYTSEDGIYAEQVHVRSLGEDIVAHAALQHAFRKSTRLDNPEQHSVYAGAAGFLNLGFIAASQPAAALLFDINPVQTLFWNEIFALMAKHEKYQDFRAELDHLPERMVARYKAAFGERRLPVRWSGMPIHYPSPQTPSIRTIFRGITDFPAWLDKKYFGLRTPDRSWLTEDRYRHLHVMAKNGALCALTIDACDDRAFDQLRAALDNTACTPVAEDGRVLPPQKGILINSLYVSNLMHFLSGEKDWTGKRNASATQARAIANFEKILHPRQRLIIASNGGANEKFSDFGYG